jgi:hypothetical protein
VLFVTEQLNFNVTLFSLVYLHILVTSIDMISLFITNQEVADDRWSGLTLEYYINPVI